MPKAKVTIFLREVMQDLAALAYNAGQTLGASAETDAPNALVPMIQDILEPGNMERNARLAALAAAEVADALFPYCKPPVREGEELTDWLEVRPAFTFPLDLPEQVSRNSIDLVSRYAHEYIVCRVLRDWLSSYNQQLAENWAYKEAEALANLRGCLAYRTGRIRRSCHPF